MHETKSNLILPIATHLQNKEQHQTQGQNQEQLCEPKIVESNQIIYDDYDDDEGIVSESSPGSSGNGQNKHCKSLSRRSTNEACKRAGTSLQPSLFNLPKFQSVKHRRFRRSKSEPVSVCDDYILVLSTQEYVFFPPSQ